MRTAPPGTMAPSSVVHVFLKPSSCPPAGVLFQCALIPDASIGMGNEGPGCFTHLGGQYIRKDQVGPWRPQAGWAAGP